MSIIGIIRNYSFEVSSSDTLFMYVYLFDFLFPITKMINESIIACNSTILRHLVFSLNAAAVLGAPLEAAQLSLDILNNIANKIDFSARKRMQFVTGYIEDLPNDELTRDMLKFTASPHMAHSTTHLYMYAARSLIAAIHSMIHEKTMINRNYVVKSLELLGKLAKDNDKESYFKGALAAPVLEQLAVLLAVGLGRYETNIVPENYGITGDVLGKSRPPLSGLPPLVVQVQNYQVPTTLPLQPQLFQQQQARMSETSGIIVPSSNLTSDQIDHEIRDLAIDCMLTLCRGNEKNAGYLVKIPNLIQLLHKTATVPIGSNSITPSHLGIIVTPQLSFRSEGNPKAAQILAAVVSVPAAHNIMRGLRGEIMVAAGADEAIAGS